MTSQQTEAINTIVNNYCGVVLHAAVSIIRYRGIQIDTAALVQNLRTATRESLVENLNALRNLSISETEAAMADQSIRVAMRAIELTLA